MNECLDYTVLDGLGELPQLVPLDIEQCDSQIDQTGLESDQSAEGQETSPSEATLALALEAERNAHNMTRNLLAESEAQRNAAVEGRDIARVMCGTFVHEKAAIAGQLQQLQDQYNHQDKALEGVFAERQQLLERCQQAEHNAANVGWLESQVRAERTESGSLRQALSAANAALRGKDEELARLGAEREELAYLYHQVRPAVLTSQGMTSDGHVVLPEVAYLPLAEDVQQTGMPHSAGMQQTTLPHSPPAAEMPETTTPGVNVRRREMPRKTKGREAWMAQHRQLRLARAAGIRMPHTARATRAYRRIALG